MKRAKKAFSSRLLHFTTPRYLLELWGIERGTKDPQDERAQHFDDDLAGMLARPNHQVS